MSKYVVIFIMSGFMFSVDYQSQIQPIFDSNCGNCHLGNSSGGLNLSTYNNLMEGSDDGAVVIPGNHEQSILWDEINSGDMPQGNNPELSDEEIDLIALWIDEGALPEESSDISGCMDSNAITCDDEIDPLYFPECDTCSDDNPCDNYYNSDATVDNGLCMYNDVPYYDEFSIEYVSGETNVIELDWSAFTPPVDVVQYILQRCVDLDGDTPVFSCEGENSCQSEFWEESCESVEGCSWNGELDGELEYETCQQVLDQNSFYVNLQ